jgi:restriction system protein
MKKYLRIISGAKGSLLADCQQHQYIGADFGMNQDLSAHLYDNWKKFNEHFIPIYQQQHPQKSKIAAGLACGSLWSICKGLNVGDIILSPDPKGQYFAAEIKGDYTYQPGEALPHRRAVRWFSQAISPDDMSAGLRATAGSANNTVELSGHATEIEQLLSGALRQVLFTNDESIEDPAVFALEKHLEEFLIENWKNTELGKHYDIFQDENGSGQQYKADSGYIDILAISKDKKTLLVVELKKGRAGDRVVGQIQRYMGYIKEELAEPGQLVKGIIIALEDDLGIRRALVVAPNIEFYRYELKFKLTKP